MAHVFQMISYSENLPEPDVIVLLPYAVSQFTKGLSPMLSISFDIFKYQEMYLHNKVLLSI